jgi:hypothetical protein
LTIAWDSRPCIMPTDCEPWPGKKKANVDIGVLNQ